MFFYLAKIFWFFAQPSGLLLTMLVAGALLLRSGRDKWGRRLIAACVALLLWQIEHIPPAAAMVERDFSVHSGLSKYTVYWPHHSVARDLDIRSPKVPAAE